MTKRILAVLLTLAMVLSLCSVNVFAAEKVYTVDPSKVTGLNGSEANIPLNPTLPAGTNVKLHLEGTADKNFRGYFANTAGSDHNLTGSTDISVEVKDGAFNYTVSLVLTNPKNGEDSASRIILKTNWDGDISTANIKFTKITYTVITEDEPEEDTKEPEYVYEDTLIHNVETLPDNNGVKAPIADGVELTGSGSWGTKAFLDWTNGNGSFASALQQPNAYVKIVLKEGGSVTDVNIQSYLGLVEGTDYGHLYNHTEVGEPEVLEDGKVVYYVDAAAIVAGYVKSINTHIANNADKEYKEGVAAIGSFGNLLIGGKGTVVSLSVVTHIKKEVVKPVEKTGRTFGFAIQLTEHMHGFLVGGKMIPMGHNAVGDVCPQCGQKLTDSTWTYVRPSGKTNHDK